MLESDSEYQPSGSGSGTQCLSKAIVSNTAKYNSFVVAEETLSKSSARAKFSVVAQHRDNKSRVTLSYVNAAVTNIRASRRGIPIRELPHKDNKLKKQKT